VHPGDRLAIRGQDLVLSRSAIVVPSARAEEFDGLVVVEHSLAREVLLRALPGPLASARLQVGSSSLDLGAPMESAAATHYVLALPDGTKATLTLADRQVTLRQGIWAVAGLLAALALALLSYGLRFGTRSLPRATATDDARPDADEKESSPSAPLSALGAPPRGEIAPAPPSASGPSEQRIGRYAILRKLGEGGMAQVFLARFEGEAGFGKLVAFKVLQPFFAAQPVAVDLFLDEARLVAGLDHPNIVQTHDLGRAGDRYFIAMEYVDGADLSRMLEALRRRHEAVPVPYAVAILSKICDGLHAAHVARGPDGAPLHLVHRDVKSANVFLSRAGVVKIGDFGIAKATHSLRMSHTEMGQVKGTPDYMPPEQRLGIEVDCRADIYGIGAIAYEMLSGQIINLDYVTLAVQGTAGWPHLPRLTELRLDVPAALDALVFKALAYDRDARFADCASLEVALRTAAVQCGIASDKDIGAWVRSELERQSGGRSSGQAIARR
jgi:serine/threonine-protein kinase